MKNKLDQYLARIAHFVDMEKNTLPWLILVTQTLQSMTKSSLKQTFGCKEFGFYVAFVGPTITMFFKMWKEHRHFWKTCLISRQFFIDLKILKI